MAKNNLLGDRVLYALGAEAWMSPVMPKDYHEYGIFFYII